MDQKLKDSDKDIFEKELFPHLQSVTKYAYFMTLNEEDAKDLVQDTYMRAIRSLDSFEKGTNAKAWLFKICKNGYINRYRQLLKRPKLVDIDEVGVGDQIDSGNKPEKNEFDKLIDNSTLGDEVSSAVNSLPLDYRTVIILCDVEGFSYEEISQILDVPIGTVRSRLNRARKLLKEKLKNYAQQFGYLN